MPPAKMAAPPPVGHRPGSHLPHHPASRDVLCEYHTPRLVVRAWTPADAAARKAAVDGNLERLRPWFVWTAADPRPVEDHVRLIMTQALDFAAGRWWSYGVWRRPPRSGDDGGGLVGALGVYHGRPDAARPSVRELSYWLTGGATGQGLATEAVGALAAAALAEPGVLGLEIRVDPANVASARVPPRLGFALRERIVGDRTADDGQPLDTFVWERLRLPARLRLATAADVPRLHAIRDLACATRQRRPAPTPTTPAFPEVAAGLCWVWADEAGVHGFAAGHPDGHPEVWTLCVDPAAQGRGVGQALLAQITDALWARGHRRLTFATAPGSRADRLCRAAGWAPVGTLPNGDVVLRRAL